MNIFWIYSHTHTHTYSLSHIYIYIYIYNKIFIAFDNKIGTRKKKKHDLHRSRDKFISQCSLARSETKTAPLKIWTRAADYKFISKAVSFISLEYSLLVHNYMLSSNNSCLILIIWLNAWYQVFRCSANNLHTGFKYSYIILTIFELIY